MSVNTRHYVEAKLKHVDYRVVLASGKAETFNATSPQLALNAVLIARPDDFPFSVDGILVMGRCCHCRGWVLKRDKYRVEPGRVYCEDC